MTIESVLQGSELGAIVALYELDASALGGPTLRFCSNLDVSGALVSYGGNEYAGIDITSEGWEFSGSGALPQPTVRIGNGTRVLSAYLVEYDDLLALPLRRIVTLDRYLDTGSDPDPNAWLRNDVYLIEQKTAETPFYIEFRLASALDQEGRRVPARQVHRDACVWEYRIYSEGLGDFIYAGAEVQCPYAGTSYFNRDDEPVSDPRDDQCSKSLTGCKLRFPKTGGIPLAYGGFPGVGAWR